MPKGKKKNKNSSVRVPRWWSGSRYSKFSCPQISYFISSNPCRQQGYTYKLKWSPATPRKLHLCTTVDSDISKIPFGSTGAPMTFQSGIDRILDHAKGQHALALLHAIIMFLYTIEEN